jgi:hypothetical protein
MKTQNFLVGLLTVGLSLSAGRAIALPIPDHAYALQRSSTNALDITGTQVTYSKGTEALAYNSTQGFITKETWAVFSANSNCWLETGAMKGAVMPTLQTKESQKIYVFQNGHYIGYQSVNQSNSQLEYHDAPYGVKTGVTGPQTYTIEKISGSGNWRVQINGTTALTLNSVVCPAGTNFLANGGHHIDVGIETSDSAAVFTSPTAASGWVISKGGGSYKAVGSATNGDSNNLQWVSNFFPAPVGSGPSGLVFTR